MTKSLKKTFSSSKFFVFLCFFTLSFSSIVSASSTISVGQLKNKAQIGANLEILKDQEGRLTIDDVINPEFTKQFNKSQIEVPNFGFTKSTYWVRFKLLNQASIEKSILLEIRYPFQNYIELFILSSDENHIVKKAGSRSQFREREHRYRNFLFDINIPAGEPLGIYIKFKTDNPMLIPLMLWNPESFWENSNRELFVLGIYYGMLIVMIFYNLFIFFSVRDKSYLYYIFYVSFFVLYQMSYTGLSFQYLWPDHYWWAEISVSLFIFLTIIFAILFAKSLLSVRSHSPKWNTVLSILILASLFGFVFLIAKDKQMIAMYSTYLGISFPPIMLITGIISWREKVRAAKYYLTAWFVFLLGALAISLKQSGIIPDTFLTEHSVQIGSIIEVVLLSLALADRINLLKQEKMEAQQKEYLAHHDSLTGLPKLKLASDRMDIAISNAKRSGQKIALLFLDLDGFKQVNDKYGHDAGDYVLQKIAKRLLAIIREGDTACRIGGDEFLVLLSSINDRGNVEDVCKRIIESIGKKIVYIKSNLFVGVSIGGAFYPDHASDSAELRKKADTIMYKVKQSGKNNYLIADDNN